MKRCYFICSFNPIILLCSRIEPFLTFSIHPDSFLPLSMIVLVVASARLFASDPATFILSTIFPDKLAFSMALVFLEFSDVLFSVWPYQVSLAVHLIIQPFTCIFLLITPYVNSVSLDFIHLEFTLIN